MDDKKFAVTLSSGKRIYEKASFINRMKPLHAEGRVCIDLTDPITGKVKKRVNGKNHVFTDGLFSGENFDWITAVSEAYTCLNDSTTTINTTIPYMFGNTVGYGIPSTSGTGTYRGAYNSENQVLAEMTTTSARWKFQYDFTAAQANGTIGTIGLTHQYDSVYNTKKRHLSGFTTGANTNNTLTCDGRYAYTCSTAGIITKYDLWLNSSSAIDVSATTGTAASYKTVGYAPATGACYIYVYSGTESSRKMYVFSDNTFSSLTNTYTPTNIAVSSYYPMYIQGDYAYWFKTGSSSEILKADFVNNVAYSTITVSTYNTAFGSLTGSFACGSCACSGSYVYAGMGYTSAPKGILFDLASDSVIAWIYGPISSTSYNCAVCLHPLTAEKICCNTYGTLFHNSAIAAKKLVSPITKTSENGMTATYEIEVFWE